MKAIVQALHKSYIPILLTHNYLFYLKILGLQPSPAC